MDNVRVIPLGSFPWIQFEESLLAQLQPNADASSSSRGLPSSSHKSPQQPSSKSHKRVVRPLYYAEFPKNHLEHFEQGLTVLAYSLTELTQTLQPLGFQKPVQMLLNTDFQDKRELQKPLQWKNANKWGRDFLLWLQHVAHYASHVPAAAPALITGQSDST